MTTRKTRRQLITEAMLERAVIAMEPDRIQGFSTQRPDGLWGAPHYIRDVTRPPGQQELWRGKNLPEMLFRVQMEKLRLAFEAAFGVDKTR